MPTNSNMIYKTGATIGGVHQSEKKIPTYRPPKNPPKTK